MGNKSSKLTPAQISDLTKATNFEKKELKQWYKSYAKEVPGGQLDKEAFKKLYAGFFPDGNSEEFAELIFRVFDADKSGKIDFKEFITALSVTSRGTLEEKLKWAFALYDVNDDGFISREEMLRIIRAIFRMTESKEARNGAATPPFGKVMPEERVNKIFADMDKNADQSLSFDEFVEGSKKDPSIIQALSLYDGLV